MSRSLTQELERIKAISTGQGYQGEDFDEALAHVRKERMGRERGGAFNKLKKLAVITGMMGMIGTGIVAGGAHYLYEAANKQISFGRLDQTTSTPGLEKNIASEYFQPNEAKHLTLRGSYDNSNHTKILCDKNDLKKCMFLTRSADHKSIDVMPSWDLRHTEGEGKAFAAAAISIVAKDSLKDKTGYSTRFYKGDLETFDLKVVQTPFGYPTTVTSGMQQEAKDKGINMPEISTKNNVIFEPGLYPVKPIHFNHDNDQAKNHADHEKHSHLPSHDTFGVGMGPQ